MIFVLMLLIFVLLMVSMQALEMGYPQALWIWAMLPLSAFAFGLGAALGTNSDSGAEEYDQNLKGDRDE